MSTMYKLIIPLLDDGFSKEDFTEEAGFLGAYTDNMNTPYITDCIFLVYEFNKLTKESYMRNVKFMELKSIHNKRFARINNKSCYIYAVTIIDPQVKRILKGLKPSNYKTIEKILKFWNFEDGDVNTCCFSPTKTFYYGRASVPEEDYIQQEHDLTQKGIEIPKTESQSPLSFIQ